MAGTVKVIRLNQNDGMTLSLDNQPEESALCRVTMKHPDELGEFEIMVGGSCRDNDLQKVVLTVTQ
jgi:hypothetical protein